MKSTAVRSNRRRPLVSRRSSRGSPERVHQRCGGSERRRGVWCSVCGVRCAPQADAGVRHAQGGEEAVLLGRRAAQ
eukprot:6697272-Pyramimonas_sp.AAC.1